MSRHAVPLLLLCGFSLPSLIGAAPARLPRAADTRPIVQGNTRFALELYDHLRQRKGNLFFSPFSLSTALAMTSAGAKGETLTEMQHTLHLPPQNQAHAGLGQLLRQTRGSGKVELTTANALWGQKGKSFLPDFVKRMHKDYDAGLSEVDFAHHPQESRKTINDWVAKKTKNHIKDLLPAGVIRANTRLVLTNAIYFHGDWASQFDKDSTRSDEFTLAGGSKVKVPLMRQRSEFRYHAQKDLQAVELPYAGGDLSMVVLLPRQSGDLGRVEKLLNPKTLSRLLFNMSKRRIDLVLPRFKLACDLKLKKELSALGMSRAFSDKADLSGLDGGKEPLALDEVVHKAFVEVNEKGTKAAASTGVIVGARSVVLLPMFRADRPFVFLIRDNRSDSILFLGRVLDPTK